MTHQNVIHPERPKKEVFQPDETFGHIEIQASGQNPPPDKNRWSDFAHQERQTSPDQPVSLEKNHQNRRLPDVSGIVEQSAEKDDFNHGF